MKSEREIIKILLEWLEGEHMDVTDEFFEWYPYVKEWVPDFKKRQE